MCNLHLSSFAAMVYQVSYELRTPEKDYSSLFKFLENEVEGVKGEGIHVLRDVWWVKVNEPFDADVFGKKIKEHLESTDIFFFAQLTSNNINGWMPSSYWTWFNQNK